MKIGLAQQSGNTLFFCIILINIIYIELKVLKANKISAWELVNLLDNFYGGYQL